MEQLAAAVHVKLQQWQVDQWRENTSVDILDAQLSTIKGYYRCVVPHSFRRGQSGDGGGLGGGTRVRWIIVCVALSAPSTMCHEMIGADANPTLNPSNLKP